MFDVVVETSGNMVTVRPKGELTVRHVEELRTVFLDVLEKSEHLVINIDDAAEIDFSCLQLFCSLHKETMNEAERF